MVFSTTQAPRDGATVVSLTADLCQGGLFAGMTVNNSILVIYLLLTATVYIFIYLSLLYTKRYYVI